MVDLWQESILQTRETRTKNDQVIQAKLELINWPKCLAQLVEIKPWEGTSGSLVNVADNWVSFRSWNVSIAQIPMSGLKEEYLEMSS